MAKQADSSVPPRAVREAIKGMSIVEVVKYKIDAWKQSRIYRRRAQKAARTKAANLLGKDPKQSRKANWPRIVKGVVIILILLWLILAAIYLVSKSPQEVPSGASAITLTSTPAIPSAADSASDDDPTALTGEVV
ncbi:MAG: hypothetical protein Q8P12_02480, partial [bacterium]|nr:hypothetical protein [bacterium]